LETATSPDFKISKRIKDDRFDVEELHNYNLAIQIGTKDMQYCVIDKRNQKCLVFEEFVFEGIRTIRDRLDIIKKVFENHHLLMAGFWNQVRLAVKTHKFTLVPSSHFSPENVVDYLVVNSEINHKIEEVYHYRQIKSNAVNVFTADKKLIAWLSELYSSKNLQIIHQGSALIEGILSNTTLAGEKAMYIYVDKGLIHVMVSENQKLLYYNQFSVKISNDFLKYVMLVFKEHSLSQKQTKIIVWGNITSQSPHLLLLKKYIRNIILGERPSSLSFNYHFDEIPDHMYFDTFCINYCD
jgi:hypothetical protein